MSWRTNNSRTLSITSPQDVKSGRTRRLVPARYQPYMSTGDHTRSALDHLQQPVDVPVKTLIDSAFRDCTERIRIELSNLRVSCTRAVAIEQREGQKWKAHCITFKQERDDARQRVQALIKAREGSCSESQEIRGKKRGRDSTEPNPEPESLEPSSSSPPQEVLSDSGSAPECLSPILLDKIDEAPPFIIPAYPPPSPTSTPSLPPLPFRTPPFRAKNTGKGRSNPNPKSKPKPKSTDMGLTYYPKSHEMRIPVEVVCERGKAVMSYEPPPTKRRRHSDSSLSDSSSSGGTLVCGGATSKEGSPVESDHSDSAIEVQDLDRGYAESEGHTYPQPVVSPRIDLQHVDVMYMLVNGKLVCQACRFSSEVKTAAAACCEPRSFAVDASWDELRDHCEVEHPAACADIARLHPAELFELRRRLMLR